MIRISQVSNGMHYVLDEVEITEDEITSVSVAPTILHTSNQRQLSQDVSYMD